MGNLSVILRLACVAAAVGPMAGVGATAPKWDAPAEAEDPPEHHEPATTSAPTSVPATAAGKSYTRGLALLEAGKDIEARAELSRALLSGELSSQHQAKAVAELATLAQATIFSSRAAEDDPCTFLYTVKEGDRLSRIAARADVAVPADMLAKINGIDGGRLKPGMKLNLIRGPFRSVVTQHAFTLDLCLQQAGEMIFVRRMKVAVGRNNLTPEGQWRVAGKATHATWNPPPSMAEEIKGPVKWGQKDYPLGKEGIFISLAGIDDQTRGLKGFGLHGTNDPASLGHARSHGCVRVGDDDIRLLYEILFEGRSTVATRK